MFSYKRSPLHLAYLLITLPILAGVGIHLILTWTAADVQNSHLWFSSIFRWVDANFGMTGVRVSFAFGVTLFIGGFFAILRQQFGRRKITL